MVVKLPGMVIACAASSIAAVGLLVLGTPANAHGGRIVGDCEIVVGFLREPPVEGEPNSVLVRVTRIADSMSGTSGVVQMDKDEADMLGIDLMATATASNTMTHGALVNQVVASGSDFPFLVGGDLVGKIVPFHTHGGDFRVTVKVDGAALSSGEIELAIAEAPAEPAVVTVRPGTKLRFANRTRGTVTLMSGMIDDGAARQVGPIEGLAGKIHVAVTHLPTGVVQGMEVREIAARRGDYVADLVPMAGAYEIRVYGEIDGMAIDETFRSGPGSFDDVEPAKPLVTAADDSIAAVLPASPDRDSGAPAALPAVTPASAERDSRLPWTAFGGIAAGIVLVVAAGVVLKKSVRKRAT